LVIKLLSNDTEEKTALFKKTQLKLLNSNIIVENTSTNDKDTNKVLQKKRLLGGAGNKKKGAAAATTTVGKKNRATRKVSLQQSRQEQNLESLSHNVWQESYVSTGQDSGDQIVQKQQKSLNFLKTQQESASKLSQTIEFNFPQLCFLFKFDFFYPWEFPFVPKLPPIPCSQTQYDTILDYFQSRLQQWNDMREQIMLYIAEQRKLFQNEQTSKALGLDLPTKPLISVQPVPKSRPKSQADRAVADINNDGDDDDNNNNHDQEDEDDEKQDKENPTGTLLRLPQISTTYAQLPNENFGNLNSAALLELCQHGSQQYKKHLERERQAVIEARLAEFGQSYNENGNTNVFTEADLNNLQLFPNKAVDNAYGYVRDVQQKLEDKQERRRQRRLLREEKRLQLQKNLLNNEQVSASQQLDLQLISSNSSDSSFSGLSGSDYDGKNGGHSDGELSNSENENENLGGNNKKTANKMLSQNQSDSNKSEKDIAMASKAYNRLPASITLLEYQAHADEGSLLEGKDRNKTKTPASKTSISRELLPSSTSKRKIVDPRNFGTVTRSGLLVLPLLQTIPFVFDTISQISSYTTGAIGTKPVEKPVDFQPVPLRYIDGEWKRDVNLNLKEKTVHLGQFE
jgi:hypothetical protein